jgi:ankyrin repeat protein
VLREINKANREHAHRLLHCLTIAVRPLRVAELAEVLAIDFDAVRQGSIPELNPDWRWADQHQAVLSTCSSLVAIVDDGYSQVVQFSHFSVKEFLTSDRLARSSGDVSRYHILLETAHTLLAQACLGVLLRLNHDVDEDNARDIPLAEYAARYWIDHAQFGKVSCHIQETMEFFFDTDKPHWAAWIRVYNIDKHWGFYSSYGVDVASLLYYAALCGFYDLVGHFICKYPEHLNARGGLLVTPLVAALYGKHFRVAELLLQHGAEVDVRGGGNEYHTPLTIACVEGPFDTVRWLLDHGADMHAYALQERRFTALHMVAYHGQLKSAQALLGHGADINARTDWEEVPLHLAASPLVHRDHLDIMQLFLDHGADPNTRNNMGSTPLHCSSYWKTDGYMLTKGTIEGAHLLLKHGADIDAKDNEGRTPLQLALAHGHDEMARFLSQYVATRSD